MPEETADEMPIDVETDSSSVPGAAVPDALQSAGRDVLDQLESGPDAGDDPDADPLVREGRRADHDELHHDPSRLAEEG